jgi:hypothetical protein
MSRKKYYIKLLLIKLRIRIPSSLSFAPQQYMHPLPNQGPLELPLHKELSRIKLESEDPFHLILLICTVS